MCVASDVQFASIEANQMAPSMVHYMLELSGKVSKRWVRFHKVGAYLTALFWPLAYNFT